MKGSLLKKGLAALAAFAVGVAGLALGASSASAAVTYGHTITLTGAANALQGRTFKAIKLAEYSDDGTNLEVTTVGTDKDDLYQKIAASLKASTDGSDPAYTTGDPMSWVAANMTDSSVKPYSGNLRNFVTDLANQLQGTDGENGTWGQYAADAGGNTKGSITYTQPANAKGGLYLILDTTADNTAATHSIPILVGTKVEGVANLGNATGQVEVKNNVPTIDKKVDTQVVGKSEYANFTVTTQVPNYVGYQQGKYVFTIEDTLKESDTAKIKFDNQFDLKVNINVNGTETQINKNTAAAGQPANGYVLTGPTGNKTFKVDLSKYIEAQAGTKTIVTEYNNGQPVAGKTATVLTAGAQDLSGKTVTLTYKALVTADTTASGAQNDVKLTYSNNPKIYNEGDTPETTEREDHEKVFNVPLKIKKTDKTTGAVLPGATFQIIDQDGTDISSKNLTATSGADGLASFAQLGLKQNANDKTKYESTFTIKETKAPADHVLPSDATFKVKISATVTGTGENAELANVTYTIVAGGGLQTFASVTGSGVASIVTVKNAKNITELPLTGAAGTAMFTVIALLLAGAAVTVYLKSRSTKRALRA